MRGEMTRGWALPSSVPPPRPTSCMLQRLATHPNLKFHLLRRRHLDQHANSLHETPCASTQSRRPSILSRRTSSRALEKRCYYNNARSSSNPRFGCCHDGISLERVRSPWALPGRLWPIYTGLHIPGMVWRGVAGLRRKHDTDWQLQFPCASAL